MENEKKEKLLELIKKRCYITASIFDEEILSLINACILDCIETGIDENIFNQNEDGNYDDLVLNCITNYVKAHRGNDRRDTNQYIKIYESIRNKLSLLKDYNSGDPNE